MIVITTVTVIPIIMEIAIQLALFLVILTINDVNGDGYFFNDKNGDIHYGDYSRP